MSDLTINITDAPKVGIKIVTLNGEMDESNLDSIKTKLDPIMDDGHTKTVLFDLTGLEFINSKGIGYFVSIHTHLSKDQRQMVLSSANEAVMDVISLVGLTTIIKYFNTVDEAMTSL